MESAVSKSTIAYHLEKDKRKAAYKRWYSKLTKEQRKQTFTYDKKKRAEYQRKRYHSDEKYRQYKINAAKKYKKSKKESNSIEEVVKGGNVQ